MGISMLAISDQTGLFPGQKASRYPTGTQLIGKNDAGNHFPAGHDQVHLSRGRIGIDLLDQVDKGIGGIRVILSSHG
jgi:hypothetical protein